MERNELSTLYPGKGNINDIFLSIDNSIIIADEEGIFKSTDEGVSWIQLPLRAKNYIAITGDNIYPFKLATFASDSNIVYLSSNNGAPGLQLRMVCLKILSNSMKLI